MFLVVSEQSQYYSVDVIALHSQVDCPEGQACKDGACYCKFPYLLNSSGVCVAPVQSDKLDGRCFDQSGYAIMPSSEELVFKHKLSCIYSILILFTLFN